MNGTVRRTGVASLGVLVSLLMWSAIAFAGGAPAKNSYSAITNSGATLQPNGIPQAIGTTTVSLTSGGLAVSTYTVTILGTSTVAAGEVTAVDVSDGTNTWSASGSYGPGSVVACTGASATPVAGTMTIRVTLAASSAGKTVGVELTSENGGNLAGLPAAGTLHNIYAPADTLSVAANTPVATAANPGNTDVQMQVLQVNTDNGGDGSLVISSVTVNDLGTATTGDIDFMKVHIDNDNNFGNGVLDTISTATWAGTSTVVDLTPMAAATRTVAFGTSKYIWITYDLNAAIAAGTTLQSSVTAIGVASPDSGASGTWSSNSISVTAGLSNTLANCAGCHNYPPADSGSRNTTTGDFVGDHDKHAAYTCATCHVAPGTETSIDFAHRTGTLNMDSGAIGVGADNGTYSKGASFAQSNSPTTGTCSNVDCHNNAVTPQWGVGTTSCSTCHGLPPATNAHTKHYTAKGWTTGTTTNCTACHPDNTAGHSDVTDSSIVVNASLTPSGVSPAISCGTAPELGCHNGKATPAWNSTATCTSCHTPGGANVADPATGLHNMTAAGVQKHDSTITGGCTACHNATKPATHANATFTPDGASNTDRFISRTGLTWTDAVANSGTCAGTSGLTGCHSDSGNWSRLWSTAANSTATATGDPRCDVCHGQFGSWRAGTSHGATFGGAASSRGSGHNSLGGTLNACEDCHIYVTDGATYHRNGVLTMNNAGGIVELGNPTYRAYCGACHSDDGDYAVSGTHTFKRTVFFPAEEISGPNDPVGSCTNCHGGGTAGSGDDNYWPDNSTAHTANQPGKHVKHMTILAGRVYGLTLQGLLDDASSATKQKALCEYCHAANTNDSDHSNTYPADVFVDADTVRHAKSLWGTADGDAAYSSATDTCSNVDCHNGKLTTDGTFGWYDAGTTTCALCHTPGGAGNNPTSGLHSIVPTVSGTTHDDSFGTGGSCTSCHTTLPAASGQTSTHINGTFSANGTLAGDRTNMGLFAAYTSAGTDNTGSCSGASVAGTCHGGSDAGTWARKWDNTVSGQTNGTECKGCHGGFAETDWTFGSVANTTDGTVEHNRDWDGATAGEVIGNHTGTTQTTACVMCHVYGDAAYVWGTHHRNGSIEMNSSLSYSSTLFNCASNCHSNPDNVNHNLEDSGWTVGNLAGPAPACTSCHTGSGSGASKVGTASSHTDPDGAGATYAAGAGNCEVCHFISHSARATGTVAVNWDTRTMGANYTADSKIYLKKLAGTETYEAEICWNCHWGTNMPSISPLIKEFGGTQGAYQTGTFNQRNWYGATWTSANFAYKTNTVASIHQAMSSTVVDPTIDTTLGATDVGTIGCTSCHDVHKVGNNGFTPAGQPYLRGSWTSNPFKEDGAPLSGQTMASDRGAVPRGIGSKAANGIGGWQIEQNNASFTNTVYSGASGFAGLCANCHTQGTLETKWSGHKGAVSGFTGGATGNNFFRTDQRGGATAWNNGNMSYAGTTTGRSGTWIGGLRNNRQWSDGVAPRDIDSLQTSGATITYPAGAVTTITFDSTTQQQNFHNFPCSKCHSPHASRLQRLMITNCLDVKHNTWDDAQGNPNTWAGSPGSYTAKQLAYSPTAQNCHRYVLGTDANREAAAEGGWNTITPW